MKTKPARYKYSQKGVINLLTILFAGLLLFTGFIVFWPKQTNPRMVNSKAVLSEGSVLSKPGSRGKAGSKRTTVLEEGTVIREADSDEETDLPPGLRVRTRLEENGRRVDVYEGAQRLRLERRSGKIVKKLENEEGEEGELPNGDEGEVFKIISEEGETEVEVSTAGASFAVSKNGVRARTNFPLSINLETNELIVTTPAGTKAVAVLPDQAVDNMILNGVITEVVDSEGTKDDDSATDSADLEDEEDNVELDVAENGELVYEVSGYTQEAFLGLFNVRIRKVAVVSAETGELREVRETLLNRLLDAFSLRG